MNLMKNDMLRRFLNWHSAGIRQTLALAFWCLFSIVAGAYNMSVSDFPGGDSRPTDDIRSVFVDSEGYVWFGTEGNGLCRFDGYETVVYRRDFNRPGLPGSNTITCLTEDSQGRIWYGTTRGACIIDKKTGRVSQLDPEGLGQGMINAILTADDGSVWLTSENRVMNYDAKTQSLLFRQIPEGAAEGRQFNSIFQDDDGSLVLTQKDGGLFVRKNGENDFKSLKWPLKGYPTSVVRDGNSLLVSTFGDGRVRLDDETGNIVNVDGTHDNYSFIVRDRLTGNLWAGGENDLYRFESDGERLRGLDTSSFLPESKKNLLSAFVDRSGNLWFTASYPKSFVVSFLPAELDGYETGVIDRQTGVHFNPLQIEPEGDILWVRQKKVGLYVFDPSNGAVSHYTPSADISLFFEKNADDNGIFVVENDSTVMLVKFDGNRFVDERVCAVKVRRGEKIRAIEDDGHGNIWIGTTYKLHRFDKSASKLETVLENTRFVNSIAVSADSTIYVATESDGVHAVRGNSVETALKPGENYRCLASSPDTTLWITTLSGRLLHLLGDGMIVDETRSCGLDGDVITDLAADREGRVWIATERKLTVYDAVGKTSRIFVKGDSPVDLEGFNSVWTSDGGDVYVAGKGGIIIVPETMIDLTDKDQVDVTLTGVRVADRNLSPDRVAGTVTLSCDEDDVELFLSTLMPLDAHKTRFAFRHKGEEKWTALPVGQNSLFLTGLPAGSHEIELRATDRYGNWSEDVTTVTIDRLPHWYETVAATMIFIVVAVIAVLAIVWRYNRKRDRRRQRQLEEQVAAMKYNFFTKVSHDLRTPLALIISPVENILETTHDETVRKPLTTVMENARNLLGLVNQLLDFRKIEMGGEQVSVSRVEIGEFVKSVCGCFSDEAERRLFDYEIHVPEESAWVMTDVSKLRKVMNNLVSNAFKFTPDGGRVTVTAKVFRREDRRSELTIEVADTGCGIAPEALPTIFECFKRADTATSVSGSGIGLHVVKEYAEMLSGEVKVMSEQGRLTVFTFTIPVEPVVDDNRVGEEVYAATDNADTNKKILIVEDNGQFRSYLRDILNGAYVTVEAVDGPDGFAKAVSEHPDIVITDLMMPGYDGIELCHRIKTDVETSHIPVILLTASGEIENERRSYEEGADAYLSKPFDKAILLSRIRNLCSRMDMRRESFKKELTPSPAEVTISAVDEALLQKALISVKNNLGNSDYSIENLSEDLCMSRSNLYRKIHSITGMTPTDFVRNTRLKEAALMLKTTTMSIEEIAYAVGFSSPGYFTRSFKKLFGMLPTQFRLEPVDIADVATR